MAIVKKTALLNGKTYGSNTKAGESKKIPQTKISPMQWPSNNLSISSPSLFDDSGINSPVVLKRRKPIYNQAFNHQTSKSPPMFEKIKPKVEQASRPPLKVHEEEKTAPMENPKYPIFKVKPMVENPSKKMDATETECPMAVEKPKGPVENIKPKIEKEQQPKKVVDKLIVKLKPESERPQQPKKSSADQKRQLTQKILSDASESEEPESPDSTAQSVLQVQDVLSGFIEKYAQKLKEKESGAGHAEQSFDEISRILTQSRTARKSTFEKLHKEIGPLMKHALKEVQKLSELDEKRKQFFIEQEASIKNCREKIAQINTTSLELLKKLSNDLHEIDQDEKTKIQEIEKSSAQKAKKSPKRRKTEPIVPTKRNKFDDLVNLFNS